MMDGLALMRDKINSKEIEKIMHWLLIIIHNYHLVITSCHPSILPAAQIQRHIQAKLS